MAGGGSSELVELGKTLDELREVVLAHREWLKGLSVRLIALEKAAKAKAKPRVVRAKRKRVK